MVTAAPLSTPMATFVERLAKNIPAHRQKDLIYLDVSNPDQPYGYNPLANVSSNNRPLVASGIIDVFKKMWGKAAWGVRMEHILRNALLALLDQPTAILPDILRLITFKNYRLQVIQNIENEQVARFWKFEFPKYSWKYQTDSIAPIQNKVGAFPSRPTSISYSY